MPVTEEYVKNYVITKLQELSVKNPKARIFVIDKLFSPDELIAEIINNTRYGRAYIEIFKKHVGEAL